MSVLQVTTTHIKTGAALTITFNKATDLLPLEDGMEMRTLVKNFSSWLKFGSLKDKFGTLASQEMTT